MSETSWMTCIGCKGRCVGCHVCGGSGFMLVDSRPFPPVNASHWGPRERR